LSSNADTQNVVYPAVRVYTQQTDNVESAPVTLSSVFDSAGLINDIQPYSAPVASGANITDIGYSEHELIQIQVVVDIQEAKSELKSTETQRNKPH